MKMSRDELRRLGYRLEDGRAVRGAVATTVPAVTPKRATAVEDRWLLVLLERHPHALIQRQFRVRVSEWDAPALVHYTADFAVFFAHESHLGMFYRIVLWEVKDRRRPYHSDELTRPKMARANNPWISQVMLASWDGKSWEERLIA